MDATCLELSEKLRTAIFDLDLDAAPKLARRIIDSGGDAHEVIDGVIKPAADQIGKKFEREDFFLPQLMLAGQALEKAMAVLLEQMPSNEDFSRPVVVIGTVKGDIHTIGKNVVAMMLKTGGFNVRDIGIDIDAGRFVDEAIEAKADIIAASSLLTTTLGYQRDLLEELEGRGLRDRFRVMIGGGPATQGWADEIGADGYGKDAAEALAVARRLTEGRC